MSKSNFINELVKNELKNTNYGRILILQKFEEQILNLNLNKDLKIAVVGGSKQEPEILLLERLGFKLDIALLGIEDSDDLIQDLKQAIN